MKATLGRLSRGSLATTTLVTVGLTVVLAVVTSEDVRVSISVGLIGVVLAVVLTVSSELHAKLDAVTRMATEPIEQLLALPHLERTVVGIIASATRAQERRSPLMSDLMTEAIEQASLRIDEVGQGVFRCETDEELRFVKLALQKTSTEVRAVAMRGVRWWQTPLSKVYFDAYGKRQPSLRGGVTRVFLLQEDEQEGIEEILAEERKRGVRAYAALASDVPESCRRAIVLFDDVLLHQTGPRLEGFGRPTVEFVDHRDEIDRAISSFETVLEIAQRKEWPADPVVTGERS